MKQILVLSIFLTMQSLIVATAQPPVHESSRLVSEVVQNVQQNILPFWEKYALDPAGGFYGSIANDGSPQPEASKGGVLNARILWTFSTAYRLFGKESYKDIADRAQAYFLTYFLDAEYGGVYWSILPDGTAMNKEKQTYGIAYAIYGLAEHFRATGNQESLKQAIALYEALEKYSYDPANGGYIESFTRDWQKPERYGYDGKGIAPKTMNTHLHVLEAYTLLYRVWPDAGLEKQLRGIIDIFLRKILDTTTWHQNLFLTMEWENLEHIDSYGHDVELSWLLYEAAETLGDPSLIREVRQVAIQLVDTQMREGWAPEGFMLYEKENGRIKGGIEWWPQAESVVAFYNAWQLTGNKTYLDASVKTWEWIKTYLVDNEYGEWYGGVRSDGAPLSNRPKANMWKCPYHNSRMAFELYSRTQSANL